MLTNKDFIYKNLIDPDNPGSFLKGRGRLRLYEVFGLEAVPSLTYASAKVLFLVLMKTFKRKVIREQKVFKFWHSISLKNFLNEMNMSNTGQVSNAIELAIEERWLRRRKKEKVRGKNVYEYSLGERFLDSFEQVDDEDE